MSRQSSVALVEALARAYPAAVALGNVLPLHAALRLPAPDWEVVQVHRGGSHQLGVRDGARYCNWSFSWLTGHRARAL